MIPELSYLCLILAGFVSAGQLILIRGDNHRSIIHAQWVVAGFVTLSFAGLTHAYVQSDFSVKNVFENSHTDKPLFYKISGVWSNHEGSMLLWCLIMAWVGVVMAASKIPSKTTSLGIYGGLNALFIGYVATVSPPFERILPAPVEGAGLTPVLQDPALAFHPPILYGGYIILAAVFAMTIGGLIKHKINADWAKGVSRWATAGWGMLTLGILLGAHWAYGELGWGGWWFWDPVENASLLPWLTATALIHSLHVTDRQSKLANWSVMLSILTFALILIGIFMVRSGLLSSVHAFANAPGRGIALFGIFITTIGGAVWIWMRGLDNVPSPTAPIPLISRAGGILINNVGMLILCGVVLIGTFYPLILQSITGQVISVGPPFYNVTFNPMALSLLILMGVAPFLDWQGRSILADRDPASIMSPLITMTLTVICVGIWIIVVTDLSAIPLIISIIAIGLAEWTGGGAVMDVIRRSRIGQVSALQSWRLFKKIPAGVKGMQIAHLGLAIAIIGMVGSTLWQADEHAVMRAGDHISVAGYEYRLESVKPAEGENYVAAIANLTPINGPDRELSPSRRLYPISDTTTAEASIIKTHTGGDLYAILGESQDGGQSAWIIRLYYNPLMAFLWTGGGLMVLGAFISVLSRRKT